MHTRRWILASVVVFAVCVAASTAHGQCRCGGPAKAKKEKKPTEPRCPVTGSPVDFSVKVAAEDGPVYFCSEGCIKKYQVKPKRFARRVAAQREATALLPKVQVTCPVTGKPVDQEISTERGDLEVYFCCESCIAKYEEKPAKYDARLANGYTYQTKCPIRGGDIDPAVFVVGQSDGSRVFFCCAGCDKRFLKDPAKYAPKLEAQGIKSDLGQIKADEKGERSKHEGRDPHDHGGHVH
jgi:YHS domain-containing protein